ncbi:MAG: hypothetical protein Q7T43_11975 [Rhodoferax sp.]|nr:hypothetical protein [Rhodoferax sp.]MDO8319897.1 hypothetical protein [Rhodoferax sp.]
MAERPEPERMVPNWFAVVPAHPAGLSGQALQTSLHDGHHLALGLQLFGLLPGRHGLLVAALLVVKPLSWIGLCFIVIGLNPTAPPLMGRAVPVGNFVLEDGNGPGRQRRLAAMGFWLFQYRHQRFLHHVFGLRGLEHHHAGVAQQALPQADPQGPFGSGRSLPALPAHASGLMIGFAGEDGRPASSHSR